MSRLAPSLSLVDAPVIVRTNLAQDPQPSVESDRWDWVAGVGVFGTSYIEADVLSGRSDGFVTPALAVSTGALVEYKMLTALLSAGGAYSGSIYVRTSRAMNLELLVQDGAAQVATVAFATTPNTWQRVGAAFTATAGAARAARLQVTDTPTTRFQAGDLITISQPLIEAGADPALPWFDGDSTYARWAANGTSVLYGYA